MTKDLVNITRKDGKQLVSGRELYERLELSERFSKWWDRMISYGFEEGKDYTPYQMVHPQNHQEIKDYLLTIPMAKELCMLQRTEIGKELRQYFIACEENWNSPEMILDRANQIQSRMLENYTQRIQQLELENKEQKEIIEIQKPKVDFYNTVTQSETTFDMAKVAKIIKYNDKSGLLTVR